MNQQNFGSQYLETETKTKKTRKPRRPPKIKYQNLEEGSHNEMALSAFRNIYDDSIFFYKSKGFREYNPKLGTWMLVSIDEMIGKVCHVIRSTPQLASLSRVNNKHFWRSFLEWLEIAEMRDVRPINPSLIGFQNYTLNTNTMQVLKHSPENFCFQSIDSEYKSGPPTKATLQFFFRLGSYDSAKINLIRGLLKLAITGDSSKQIIPYLAYGSGSGKTTFFKFLRRLSFGNSVDTSLNAWGTQFGKSSIIGAFLVIFDDIDYNGLKNGSAADIKKFSSGSDMQIDRKNMDLVTTPGGLIFISGNKPFNYKSVPNLRTDEGWNRRLIVIPVDERSSFEPIRDDSKFEEILVSDASCLFSWALAMPDSVMVNVGRKAARITQLLGGESDSLQRNIGNFLCECVRLDPNSSVPGGFGVKRVENTLGDEFAKYCEERELLVPTGRFTFKDGLATMLRQLKLDRLVKAVQKRHGWEYVGLTLSKEKGKHIKFSPSTTFKELQDTPLCSRVDENRKVVSFDYEGVSTNSDILKFIKSYSPIKE